MQELKLHFQTDPEDEIDNSAKQYDDIEDSEYKTLSQLQVS